MILGTDESIDIPEGCEKATITNKEVNNDGSYSIKGETSEIKKEIPGGDTQVIEIKNDMVKIVNTDYPLIEVVF